MTPNETRKSVAPRSEIALPFAVHADLSADAASAGGVTLACARDQPKHVSSITIPTSYLTHAKLGIGAVPFPTT